MQEIESTSTSNEKRTAATHPVVFDYVDYRSFLKDFCDAKKKTNHTFSMSAFIRRAGLPENSRGYLKLVIEGKRNLSIHTVRRFVEALSLKGQEATYFENLVAFNQAKNTKDREYYLQKLSDSAQNKKTPQFELLRSQYKFYSNWYYVAVRELVGLSSFLEDLDWICTALKKKITKKQAREAIDDLLQLGLLSRDANGKLMQTEPLIKFDGSVFNETVRQFHLQMLDRAKEALVEDPYEERSASCLTLSCDADKLSEIRKRVSGLRDELNQKFGVGSKNPNAVIQVNFQIFQLSSPKDQRQPGPAKGDE